MGAVEKRGNKKRGMMALAVSLVMKIKAAEVGRIHLDQFVGLT